MKKQLKHGDLVAVKGETRRYVAVEISYTEWRRRGLNVSGPGVHLFGGYWYPGHPLTPDPYGKVLDLKYLDDSELHVVGKVRTHYAAERHCR